MVTSNLFPSSTKTPTFPWMREIQDWCISRQQWWGHQIPAYYDDAGAIYVASSEEAAREKYDLPSSVSLRRDEDVLETWFSSALWPFATLGWPEDTPELDQFLPSNTLVTGHDIIFFWVARMIMMTLHFTGRIPFRKVYVHGLVKGADGQKMSKTKGNGLDPLDFVDGISLDALIEKRTSNLTQPQMAPRIEKSTRKDFADGIPAYGTDALRFTFCALATSGRDVRFDLNRIEGNRNFCNKLWNATKFVLMNTEALDPEAPAEATNIDKWISSKLVGLINDTNFALETYRFDLYASAIYEFAWHEYCDWYLELTKPLLWDDDVSDAQKNGIRRSLLTVLEALLRIAHPVMPFITDTLWRQVAPRLVPHQASVDGSIMTRNYPLASDYPADAAAEAEVEWLKGAISAIRTIRGEANIKPSQVVPLLLQSGTPQDADYAKNSASMLARLANVASIEWVENGVEPPPHALALHGELRIMIPLAGLIDVDAERGRLQKELDKAAKDQQRLEGKLGNDKFVNNAPEEVVAKERDKLANLEVRVATLTDQLNKLDDL